VYFFCQEKSVNLFDLETKTNIFNDIIIRFDYVQYLLIWCLNLRTAFAIEIISTGATNQSC
jgi:hypothetical protein